MGSNPRVYATPLEPFGTRVKTSLKHVNVCMARRQVIITHCTAQSVVCPILIVTVAPVDARP